MNRKIVEIDPLQDERWDEFVNEHPEGWISSLSGWKKVLEGSFKHIKGRHLAVVCGKEIRATLPIYEITSSLTGRRFVSIPFATRSHPLFEDEEDLRLLCQEANRQGRDRRISRVEIRCVAAEVLLGQFPDAIVSSQFKEHALSLSPGTEKLFKCFHKTAVQQPIKRAEKSGVVVRRLSSKNDFKNFYELYCTTRRRIGLPPQPEVFMRLLWEQFSPNGQAQCYLAEKDETLLAGLLVFKYRNRVSAEYTCSRHVWHYVGTVPFLYWHAITDACRQGYEIFDFGRTDERNTSLMQFKNRWGADVGDLPVYHYPMTRKKNMSANFLNADKLLKGVLKRIPMPIVKRIGGICYRHMG